AALRPDPADGRRRAARDFRVPRLESARRADRALPWVAGPARARASGPARGVDGGRRAGLQRLDAAAHALVYRSPAVPRVRHTRRGDIERSPDPGPRTWPPRD